MDLVTAVVRPATGTIQGTDAWIAHLGAWHIECHTFLLYLSENMVRKTGTGPSAPQPGLGPATPGEHVKKNESGVKNHVKKRNFNMIYHGDI